MKIVVNSNKLNRSESVDSESLITFQNGILGFPGIKKYLLVEYEKGHPFFWLQASDDPDLGFIVVDPLIVVPDYRPDFSDSDLQALEIKDTESMAMLSIVTVPQDDPMRLSANLMAPLLINHKIRSGKQIVLNDSGYNIREPIIKSDAPSQKLLINHSSRVSLS